MLGGRLSTILKRSVRSRYNLERPAKAFFGSSTPDREQESEIVDTNPLKRTQVSVSSSSAAGDPTCKSEKISPRLPQVLALEEFPGENVHQAARQRQRKATLRILGLAGERLSDPPTLHLLAASLAATLGISALEGSLLCQEIPIIESWQSAEFVAWYAMEQVVPSIVWTSQDPLWVAQSLGMDPSSILYDFSSGSLQDATTLLRVRTLEVSRYLVAGFMMIASIVRAAGVSAGAFQAYEDGIRGGRQPPFSITNGQIVRLCGQRSFTTEVSLQRMGTHMVPIFENPKLIQSLVWKHSEDLRTPVYWCVSEGKYGSAFSWDKFPTETSSLLQVDGEKERLLILEADATNPNDPLALGNEALDLTLDDASQGFRRLEERFRLRFPKTDFRTLRVYLGNSMEVAKTGGGHAYTLRHRVRYAKEVDVLIDSRAPVLEKILDWCRRVTGKDKKLFLQTSSPEYFQSLQRILHCYGYEIYDPLDLRNGRHKRKIDARRKGQKTQSDDDLDLVFDKFMSDPEFYELMQELGVRELLESTIDEEPKSQMLRDVAKLSRLPRLVHMPTTAETVNAVEALINAGEVHATHCCAILERHDGMQALESVLHRQSNLEKSSTDRYKWIDRKEEEDEKSAVPDDQSSQSSPMKSNGLQLICTSTLYDDLFRQVRMWSRMGFSSTQIQKEIDLQFHEILENSHDKSVVDSLTTENKQDFNDTE